MNQIGYVKEVKESTAHVIFKRETSCGDNCASCSSSCETPPLTLEFDNSKVLAEKGNYVEVNMEDDTFFKLTMFAYVVPLILMLLGVSLGYYITHNELTAAFTGLAFLAISYVILRLVNNNHVKHQRETVSLIRVIPEDEALKVLNSSII